MVRFAWERWLLANPFVLWHGSNAMLPRVTALVGQADGLPLLAPEQGASLLYTVAAGIHGRQA